MDPLLNSFRTRRVDAEQSGVMGIRGDALGARLALEPLISEGVLHLSGSALRSSSFQNIFGSRVTWMLVS